MSAGQGRRNGRWAATTAYIRRAGPATVTDVVTGVGGARHMVDHTLRALVRVRHLERYRDPARGWVYDLPDWARPKRPTALDEVAAFVAAGLTTPAQIAAAMGRPVALVRMWMGAR